MGDLSFTGLTLSSKRLKEQFYSVTPVMVGRGVQSLLLACSAGSELLYLGKVSQASQESQIRGVTNCQFPSWCSCLLIPPAFPLNHLAYVCTVLRKNEHCFESMVSLHGIWKIYFLSYVFSLYLWGSKPAFPTPLTVLLHFSCNWVQSPACSWGFDFLTFTSLSHALAFLLNVDSCVLASRLFLNIHSEILWLQ